MLTRKVLFRIEDDKYKTLEKLARKENRTVSSLIRDILYRVLKEKK